jgi:predicted phosphoadenosine phosphosulfate sulfurtransferase
MPRQKYFDHDVVVEARNRISYIFDEFENINVSISGGKDSTVLAHLALTEAHRRNRRIGIFFLDEEVVYQSTVEQVRYLMELYPENTIKLWYQIEFNLTNSTSLREDQLKCWEAGKHKIWMRTKEPDSIKFPEWDRTTETVSDKNKGFGFYDALDNFQRAHPNTACLVGLRAVESPNRWRAVVKNPAYKHIYWATDKTKISKGTYNFYPIFDWNYWDIWKYIHDNKVRYSKIYDYMYMKGMSITEMRVSSLIHEKSFKSLVELPEFEPKTYDKLVKRIAGIQVGNLYGKDDKLLRCRKLPKNYDTWLQYRDFLLQTYPEPDKKHIFEKRFSKHLNNNYVARQQCRQLILNDFENNLPVNNDVDPREERLNYWKSVL